MSNFRQSSYFNLQGKEQPYYEMTKDGFTLLAMGFTGKKALILWFLTILLKTQKAVALALSTLSQ